MIMSLLIPVGGEAAFSLGAIILVIFTTLACMRDAADCGATFCVVPNRFVPNSWNALSNKPRITWLFMLILDLHV